MTTASAAKAAHVLVVGCPDCDAELQHWLDSHARVEHVDSIEDALDALRHGTFDMVFSGAADLLPTPSVPLSRPALAILDHIPQGVCLVRKNGEVEWINARMMTLPSVVRDRVRDWCVQVLTASAESGSPGSAAKRLTLAAGSETYAATVTPILDRQQRAVQAAAVVEETGRAASTGNRGGDVHRAGQELLTLDVQQFSRLEPQERLALLERRIWHAVQVVLPAESFDIRVLDSSSNKLELVMCLGVPGAEDTNELYALAEGNGISGYVAVSGKPYLCADTAADPRYIRGLEGARSSLTVPLRVQERIVGVANFESGKLAAFSDDDATGAEMLGRYIGLALHTMELLAGERQATMAQMGRTIVGEITGPLNDVFTDVESLMEAVGDRADVRERLQAIAGNAAQIREMAKEWTAARPTLLGARTAATRRVDPVLEGRRVLLADDEEILRDTVRDVLIGYGCKVCTAADGACAIDWIGRQAFDLVLSDIRMPIKNGYEVFAAAKQANPHTPVILTTGFGYDPNHTIIRARREGLAAVLFKPFKVDQLLAEIRQALKSAAK